MQNGLIPPHVFGVVSVWLLLFGSISGRLIEVAIEP